MPGVHHVDEPVIRGDAADYGGDSIKGRQNSEKARQNGVKMALTRIDSKVRFLITNAPSKCIVRLTFHQPFWPLAST